MSEKRPVDCVDDAVRLTTDAAELVEHLRDEKTEPITEGREILYDALVELIDEAHGQCLEASVQLDENEKRTNATIHEPYGARNGGITDDD